MGYLDDYSTVTGARRETIHKALLVALLISVVAGGVLYFWFKNFFEERQVRQFLSRLQENHYAEAYVHWGCSVEEPCPDYTYEDFLEDWGPDSPLGTVRSFDLGRSTELDTGVIIEIEINGKLQPELWVEKETQIVGFSPYHFRRTGASSANRLYGKAGPADRSQRFQTPGQSHGRQSAVSAEATPRSERPAGKLSLGAGLGLRVIVKRA